MDNILLNLGSLHDIMMFSKSLNPNDFTKEKLERCFKWIKYFEKLHESMDHNKKVKQAVKTKLQAMMSNESNNPMNAVDMLRDCRHKVSENLLNNKHFPPSMMPLLFSFLGTSEFVKSIIKKRVHMNAVVTHVTTPIALISGQALCNFLLSKGLEIRLQIQSYFNEHAQTEDGVKFITDLCNNTFRNTCRMHALGMLISSFLPYHCHGYVKEDSLHFTGLLKWLESLNLKSDDILQLPIDIILPLTWKYQQLFSFYFSAIQNEVDTVVEQHLLKNITSCTPINQLNNQHDINNLKDILNKMMRFNSCQNENNIDEFNMKLTLSTKLYTLAKHYPLPNIWQDILEYIKC